MTKPTPCTCKSYNRPDLGGDTPEIILTPPPVLAGAMGKTSICVDPCIAHIVKALWAAGICTQSSCCGHNGQLPRHVVVDKLAAPKALQIVRDLDADMDVNFWTLATAKHPEPGIRGKSSGLIISDDLDPTLWAVNITGPDDILAVSSRAEAVDLATRFNKVVTERFEVDPNPYAPLLWAMPTQWPHSRTAHAECLGKLGDYAWLSQEPKQ